MIDAILSSPFVERFGWVLVHSTWQLAAIGLLAWATSAALRRASAEVRCWILLGCLGLMACSPIATWAWMSREPVAKTSDEVIATTKAMAVTTAPEHTPTANAEATLAQTPVVGEAIPSAPAQSARWLGWIVAAWTVGAALCALRPILGWRAVHRLRTVGVSEAPAPIAERFAELLRTSGASRATKLLQSLLVKSPVVVGWLKPVVLLPVGMCTGMPLDQIEAVLLHELAHVRRRDFLLNALQTIVETALFHHPAVWWLSHRIRCEREFCCDDIVVRKSPDRMTYGRALLALAEMESRTPALAVASTGGLLTRRIERILGVDQPRAGTRPSIFGAGLVAAMLAAAAFWLFVPTRSVLAADEPRWGAASNGISIRATVVPANTDEQKPAEAKPARDALRRGEDLTLKVEVRNQSDREVAFVGVRYGDGVAAPSKGVSATDHFAPYLFDFEILDSAGKPVDFARPARKQGEETLIFSGGSVEKLAPGTQTTLLIRPLKWSAIASPGLASGEYKIRIRCRGVAEATQAAIRKHWPQLSTGNAWFGDAVAPDYAFRVETRPTDKPADLAWGEPVRGLRAAVEFRNKRSDASAGFPFGVSASPVIHIQNVSEKPISFWSETWRQDDTLFVIGPDGKETPLTHPWYSGWPVMQKWTLKPGQTAALTTIAMGFAPDAASAQKLDKPVGAVVVGPPGERRLRINVHIGSIQQQDASGKKIIPGEGDWTGDLSTGITTIKVKEAAPSRDPAK